MNLQSTNSILSKKELSRKKRKKKLKNIVIGWELYLFLLPAFIYFVVFHYVPLYGLLIAFKNYIPTVGVWGSPWVGFQWFDQFFQSYYFWQLIKNTIEISVYSLIVGFPMPIILALAFNELRKNGFIKRGLQTVTYAPHFISLVVMVGMIISFLAPRTGLINHLLGLFGIAPISFMSDPSWFKTIFVLSDSWQGMGWGSIIYMAALSGVDPMLHESAEIDGASRWHKIRYINIPSLIPTMTILFILNMGGLLSVGFQKILLMQNNLNMGSSDVIATFVYRTGILNAQYSYSTAVGLFDAVINAALLVTINQISKKFSENSLW